MMPSPVNLPISLLVNSATLPLRTGVSRAVWGGRAITWLRNKYSENQAHKVRLKVVHSFASYYEGQSDRFANLRSRLVDGEDVTNELDQDLQNIKNFVKRLKSDGSVHKKYLPAIEDMEGYKKILTRLKYFPKDKYGTAPKFFKLSFNRGDTGFGRSKLAFLEQQTDEVINNTKVNTDVSIERTNRLNLFIPGGKLQKGAPVKVLIEAHGIAIPHNAKNGFKVGKNGAVLKYFGAFGSPVRFNRISKNPLNVLEVQKMSSGQKAQDYILTAFSGIRSACRVRVDGKTLKDEDVPLESRRNAQPIIHEEDADLKRYAEDTNTIVVSPKLVDQNDKKVEIELSEIYNILQKRYPDNPLEISCKFCRGI